MLQSVSYGMKRYTDNKFWQYATLTAVRKKGTNSMKKILLFVLAALVLVSLVACGGETTTETTTTQTPGTTAAPDNGDNVTTDGGSNDDTPPTQEEEGINIISGELEYMAINAFRMGGGVRAGTFENWHTGDDWYYVFGIDDVEAMINEQLFEYDLESDRVFPWSDFKWILVIDDEAIEITEFYCVARTGFNWVRCKMPESWTFKEDGHAYDIKVQICDAADDTVVYYAWLTDPDLAGPYEFSLPTPTAMVADPNGGADLEKEVLLSNGQVVALGGPVGSATSELYPNVFDDSFDTKLCTRDMTQNLVFQIADDVWKETIQVTSFSIVGANDDAKHTDRVLSKFRIEGAYDSGDEDADWQTVLEIDKSDDFGDVVNYGERHYELDEAVNYKYYRLIVLGSDDSAKEIYQLSEILVYISQD